MTKSFPLRAAGAFLAVCALTLACSGDDSNEPSGPRIPASIILVPNEPVIPQGLSIKLKATVVDATGREITGQAVTFSSNDESVVTVDADGNMHSVGPLGTVRVTADLNGLTSRVDVEIAQRIVSLATQPESLVINRGLTAFLSVSFKDFAGNPVYTAHPVTFTSSNPTLATVDGGGSIQAGNTNGTGTITVAIDTFHLAVPFRVGQIPSEITTDPENVVMQPGGTRQLVITVRDLANALIVSPPVTFTSNAPTLFSVSGNGLVTSLGGNGGGTLKVKVDQLEKVIGVFVGAPVPQAVTHTTALGTAAYEADIGPAGQVVVSEPDGARAVRGTLPGTSLSTTLTTAATALGVAVNHAGTRAYVASGSEMSILDLVNNQPLAPIHVDGGGSKIAVAVSNDDQFAYLGTLSYVYIIDLTAGAVVDSVRVDDAFFLAVHPSQPKLYAGEGSVREIDLTSRTVSRTFSGGIAIKEIALSPDGNELYAADEGAGALRVFSVPTGLITQTVPVPFGAFGLASSPHLIVVTTGNGVALFDRASRVPITNITLGGQPRRPAIDASESTIVVPNEGGWVDYIQ